MNSLQKLSFHFFIFVLHLFLYTCLFWKVCCPFLFCTIATSHTFLHSFFFSWYWAPISRGLHEWISRNLDVSLHSVMADGKSEIISQKLGEGMIKNYRVQCGQTWSVLNDYVVKTQMYNIRPIYLGSFLKFAYILHKNLIFISHFL